jgi:type I restriction enzyme R subunit
MAKLRNIKGRYCESEFENAFIGFLEGESWQYLPGQDIARANRAEVLHMDDLLTFLGKDRRLSNKDIQTIADEVRLVGSDSHYATLHKVYKWLSNGYSFTSERGEPYMVNLVDYENSERNIFRVVNQLEIDYTNKGETKNRRPDVLLYINGIPVCIIELKNPADEHATINDAFEQITIRYWRDIPHLLHYCPLACISDGVKTRLGTVRTPYEHFYAWRRINNEDKVSTTPFDELQSMIKGVFAPKRLLEIFRDYIIFEDDTYDRDEKEIVCRYPQFFASRLLRESIKKSVNQKNGKGGTYFGATGCGKTYTMAYLARQLSIRCTDVLGSPTIIMIVDRDDLQSQGFNKVFGKCSDFLSLGEVKIVESRDTLRKELKVREIGGFYICTIQKFCDRKDDPIGLINKRANIICFSDEAHRTQLEHSKEIKFSMDADENMKAVISRPYAQVLREAFPHATFVGFTGTPIAETYQTFGDEIDRYTMDQAVADGLTVPIKYHPRITKVLFDEKKIKEIEEYYNFCLTKEGGNASQEDVLASKKAMSCMELIVGEDGRLERLCKDIHDHYTKACDADPDRVQKAMIVCMNRKIAYRLLQKFQSHYPEWFEEKKTPDGTTVTREELAELKLMPTMAMVASVGSNDEESMYNYLGGVKNLSRSKELDAAFKQDKSNFRIVIVVDMWITGFDVESLTYLYNDKPLQKHMLVQTISRVNRKYPGKEYGLIVDYLGIRGSMLQAMKLYGGGTESLAPSEDDIEQALEVFRDYLGILKQMFQEQKGETAVCMDDIFAFAKNDISDTMRYTLLSKAAEFVFRSTQIYSLLSDDGKKTRKVSFQKYFLECTKRMKLAHNLCQPSGVLSDEETALAQCFMAIAGFVRKMTGSGDVDTDSMNRHVEKMVEEALKYNEVESILEEGEEEDIYGPDFVERIKHSKMPTTSLEMLIKLLKREIRDYGKTNGVASKKYQELLEQTIKEYHERRKNLSEDEANEAQNQASDEIIQSATNQALKILRDMNADKESFRKMGLTFEEKAFYDILIKLRDDFNFEFGEDKKIDGIVVNEQCKSLARKIKEIIDTKSSFADWLNNQNVQDKLKFDIKICLIKNGYPPQYSPEVFRKVMDQVENFNENHYDED